MDFALTDEQVEIDDLCGRILEDTLTQERLREIEATDEPGFDRKLWATLAEAGLLGVAIPEAAGGLGLGVLEAALILEQVGRTVAPVPLVSLLPATVVLSRYAVGTPKVAELLGQVAAGEKIVTVALVETLGDPYAPGSPPSATAPAGCSTARRPACRPACTPTTCWCRRRCPAVAMPAFSWWPRTRPG